jgi:hypothetical protein
VSPEPKHHINKGGKMKKIPEEARQFQAGIKLGQLLGLNHETIAKSFSRTNGRSGGYQFERRAATPEERHEVSVRFVYRVKSRAKMNKGGPKPKSKPKVDITPELLEWQPAATLSAKIGQDRDRLIQAAQRGELLGGLYSVIRREMTDFEKKRFPGKFVYRVTTKPGVAPKKAQSYRERISSLEEQVVAKDKVIEDLRKAADRKPTDFEKDALDEVDKLEKKLEASDSKIQKASEDMAAAKANLKKATALADVRTKEHKAQLEELSRELTTRKNKIAALNREAEEFKEFDKQMRARDAQFQRRIRELESEGGAPLELTELTDLLDAIQALVEEDASASLSDADVRVVVSAFKLTRKIAGLGTPKPRRKSVRAIHKDLSSEEIEDLVGEDFFEEMG